MEWAGRAGAAEIAIHLPHEYARMTNFLGEQAKPLTGASGLYRFPIRPQQIATLRFRLASSVPDVAAILDWSPLTPRFKRQPLEVNEPVKGYPAITRQPTQDDFGAKARQ